MKKTLSVTAIKEGTVVDHIRAGAGLSVLNILNIPINGVQSTEAALKDALQVTIGLNLPSKSGGHKDLIKLAGRTLTRKEMGYVALLSPGATINVIKNYKVAKKTVARLPKSINRLLVCANPTCITNNEPAETNFMVDSEKDKVLLQCAYCEKVFNQNDVKKYNL